MKTKRIFVFVLPERLDEVRKKQIELKIPPQKYDELCEVAKELLTQKNPMGKNL